MTKKSKNTPIENSIDSMPASVETDKNPQIDKKDTTKPRHFRKTAQETIGENYKTIVEELAKAASKGSVQHTRLLFDLGDVKEEVRASAKTKRRRKAPSLSKMLMDEVMKRRKEQSANKDAEAK
jgi:hypothetical protein